MFVGLAHATSSHTIYIGNLDERRQAMIKQIIMLLLAFAITVIALKLN